MSKRGLNTRLSQLMRDRLCAQLTVYVLVTTQQVQRLDPLASAEDELFLRLRPVRASHA